MTQPRKVDRRIRRTRRQLYRALHALIKAMPYDEISVSKIVDEADISRATFYLHYKDKYELLVASLESLLAELLETLKSAPPADLQSLGLHIFQHIYDHQAIYQALHQTDTASFVMLNAWIEIVQAQLQSSMISVDDDSITQDRVAHQVAGGLYALIVWWLKQDKRYSPQAMAEAFADFKMPRTKPPTY